MGTGSTMLLQQSKGRQPGQPALVAAAPGEKQEKELAKPKDPTKKKEAKEKTGGEKHFPPGFPPELIEQLPPEVAKAMAEVEKLNRKMEKASTDYTAAIEKLVQATKKATKVDELQKLKDLAGQVTKAGEEVKRLEKLMIEKSKTLSETIPLSIDPDDFPPGGLPPHIIPGEIPPGSLPPVQP